MISFMDAHLEVAPVLQWLLIGCEGDEPTVTSSLAVAQQARDAGETVIPIINGERRYDLIWPTA
jgi:hypothetical protein